MTAGYELAQQWARGQRERVVLEAQLEQVRTQLEDVKLNQDAVVKELRQGLSGTAKRLYDVGQGQVVLVTGAGVELVTAETAPQTEATE